MNNKGFSVIELVIVLVILGLVGFWLIPGLQKSNSARFLKASSRVLTSDLLAVRSAAMSSGRTHKVVFDVGDSTYEVYKQDTDDNTLWRLIKNAKPFADSVLMESTTLPNSQVIFDALGTPYEDPSTKGPHETFELPLLVSRNVTISNESQQIRVYILPEQGMILEGGVE